MSDLSLNFGMKSNVISAPTSPAKNVSSFLSRATSLTSSVTSNVAGVAGRISSGIKELGKQKIVLVVDDHQTDWSKSFRGKRILNEFDVRVEQAEFKDLNIHSNSENGVTCVITIPDKSGLRSSKPFRPDFLLVRQHICDINIDYRNIILGLKYGGLPSINSLHSLYNLADGPWAFSQLIGIQRRLGREHFPLLEQTYYPNSKELLNNPPRFPCVIKIGHSHNKKGKIQINNLTEFQEIMSIVSFSNTFITTEPFIEAKCDLHIQKIGATYKAFMRKSISENWKGNIGPFMLEQCPINERYRKWLDEVSEIFNGLDIVALEGVIGRDGKEYIYDVVGSQMTLLGEAQEEDRKLIADLVCAKLQNFCGRSSVTKQTFGSSGISSVHSIDDQTSIENSSLRSQSSIHSTSGNPSGSYLQRQGPARQESGSFPASQFRLSSQSSVGSDGPISAGSISPGNPVSNEGGITSQISHATQQVKSLLRRASASNDEPTTGSKEDSEDTMRNLRKTFAGIFGDM